MKGMRHKVWGYCLTLLYVITPVYSEETLHLPVNSSQEEAPTISVNFESVSVLELLRFVSKIAEVNFIYDEKLLDFTVSLMTNKPTYPKKILNILFEVLEKQGIKVEQKEGFYVVEKMADWEWDRLREDHSLPPLNPASNPAFNSSSPPYSAPSLNPFLDSTSNSALDSTSNPASNPTLDSTLENSKKQKEIHPVINQSKKRSLLSYQQFHKQRQGEFHIYKLQYHQGRKILETIKGVSIDLKNNTQISPDFITAIQSMQWMESTNSLVYSGSIRGIKQLTTLIDRLDVPKKQVFIEVLVIETNVKNGLDFGLEWGGGGKYRNKFGYGVGNFPPHSKGTPSFAQTLQGINSTETPTGTDQIPLGNGFDLGIIGDIILHKGHSYFSLGTLLSALEVEGDTTIILNQKIITQDNKLSTIFVGDNIPFTGSIVTTAGASTQTSTNIEYRDVGVTLNITPLLGEGEIITLDISEEITEAVHDMFQNQGGVGGIQTTKTDMNTQVHVPDKSFLVLSGMIRNTKRKQKTGIPCLGGLPWVGAAFSRTSRESEKRNVVVFVHPQIIHSSEDHHTITAWQEKQFKTASGSQQDFERGVDMLKNKETEYGTNHSNKPRSPEIIVQSPKEKSEAHLNNG